LNVLIYGSVELSVGVSIPRVDGSENGEVLFL
jgi:hypothetical protein